MASAEVIEHVKLDTYQGEDASLKCHQNHGGVAMPVPIGSGRTRLLGMLARALRMTAADAVRSLYCDPFQGSGM
jgi:hypothetical protein